jgi:hypothetical protein
MRAPNHMLIAALLLPLAGNAARAEGAALTTESPFVVQGEVAGGPGAQAASAIEFRGIMSQDGVLYFNLYDVAKRKGTWVTVNEPGPQGWVVRSHELAGDNEQVTVEGGGRTQRLPLAKPKAGKLVVAAQPQGQPAPAQGIGAPITQVVLNPTPAQQAKAQEDIMAEVRRRRLQRQQQAAQQAGGAQPPPPGQ